MCVYSYVSLVKKIVKMQVKWRLNFNGWYILLQQRNSLDTVGYVCPVIICVDTPYPILSFEFQSIGIKKM